MNASDTGASARAAAEGISIKIKLYETASSRAADTWKGDAGEAWRDFNRNMLDSLDIMIRKYFDLSVCLRGLDSAIDCALDSALKDEVKKATRLR
jgi:hypothetical protein